MNLVIIGGIAGGSSAATHARRHSETATIAIIKRGCDVSFSNCDLPYHLGGKTPNRSDLENELTAHGMTLRTRK